MSRTDRDMTRWRWNQHFKLTDGVSEHGGYVWDRGCPCYREPDAWKWRSWYSPHSGRGTASCGQTVYREPKERMMGRYPSPWLKPGASCAVR